MGQIALGARLCFATVQTPAAVVGPQMIFNDPLGRRWADQGPR
jgi:hypothetical protein